MDEVHEYMWTDKLCNGQWGFCGSLRHVSGFELFCSQVESTPASRPLAQAFGYDLGRNEIWANMTRPSSR
jgi:hypothetical protein